MRLVGIAPIIVAIATLAHVGRAQGPALTAATPSYIDVLRTQTDLRQATTELARASALRDHAMLSLSEYDERRAAWERARLAHVSALLNATSARARLAIVRAVKSRRTDGRLDIALTLRNESRPLDLASLGDDSVTTGDLDARAIAEWTTVRGAAVALKTETGANGATISRPYERTLPDLAPGAATVVAFDLLEDVGDVVVAIESGGRLDERRIRLEVGATDHDVAVDASQFSLEGDLGGQVVYDLRLQRARPSASALRLDARGLPSEVAFEFRDVAGRTRLRQLRFADGATSASVQLVVSLPERPSTALPVDRPLTFDVVATDDGAPVPNASGSAGVAHLELLPRGTARLELRPATLAIDASSSRPTLLPVTIRNAGTGRVDDVRLRVEPPPRWQVSASPASIPRLAPGDEARVQLQLRPADDAVVGDYEVRIGVDDAGTARHIDVEDKLVRLRLVGESSLVTPWLLVLAAAAITLLLFTRGRRWINR